MVSLVPFAEIVGFSGQIEAALKAGMDDVMVSPAQTVGGYEDLSIPCNDAEQAIQNR